MTYESGLTIIERMKDSVANEYITDQINEDYGPVGSYLEDMKGYILIGDFEAAGKVFRDCVVDAGNRVLERDKK